MFERKRDPPGLRSVFRLSAPRFEELENARDDDHTDWGALLLKETFGEVEFTDAVSFGHEAIVVVQGMRFQVAVGFQGPSWLGFVNFASTLSDTPSSRSALVALDRALRETVGVLEVKWSDLATFDAGLDDWQDGPVAQPRG